VHGDSHYDNPRDIERAVSEGRHRSVIGGLWDELGTLQFQFLRSVGLQPCHTLLDVGCGSLRGGTHFVRYLDPGRYYGIDLNQPLLDAGYEREITPLGLAEKLPRSNLACTGEFDATGFGTIFDYLVGVSLFTHLNWCRIRLCMERLLPVTRLGSVLCATYFDLPEGESGSAPRVQPPAGITTFGHRDPFHYRISDIRQAISGMPWMLTRAQDWGHPRGQRMLTFLRS
jgi:hypothetical protein